MGNNLAVLTTVRSVVVVHGTLAAGASVIIQPAAGLRYAVNTYTDNITREVTVYLTTNGTDWYFFGRAMCREEGFSTATGVGAGYSPLLITNTEYIKLTNTSAGGIYYLVNGIET